MVKDVFLAMLPYTPTLTKISELMRVSPPLTFANAPVCVIEPPAGFEALSAAIAERCAITMVYEPGWQRPSPRLITPRLVLEVYGVIYVIAYCHVSEAERTFRLDRIQGVGSSSRCGTHGQVHHAKGMGTLATLVLGEAVSTDRCEASPRQREGRAVIKAGRSTPHDPSSTGSRGTVRSATRQIAMDGQHASERVIPQPSRLSGVKRALIKSPEGLDSRQTCLYIPMP
jgi:hypothetical protein